MTRRGRLCLAAAALGLVGFAVPAQADDPPDMVTAAKGTAEGAPVRLGRRSLGQVVLPTIATAQWRNVRANYIREELVNDQIVFCGELDAVVPGTERRSGWTRFMYMPGDPAELATETDGLGMPEIGKRIVAKYCDGPNLKWLSADYTAYFQKLPEELAEARVASGAAR